MTRSTGCRLRQQDIRYKCEVCLPQVACPPWRLFPQGLLGMFSLMDLFSFRDLKV